jgi:hypothetical protein
MPEATPTTASGDALAGVVPGIAAVAALFLALRVLGLAPVAAFALADAAGVALGVLVTRRAAAAQAAVGLTVVLVLSFSLLLGVLAEFLLAVAGVA